MLWIIILLIVLAPLPEGSAQPWALALIEAVIFGMVSYWLCSAAWFKHPLGSLNRARPLLLPTTLFLMLILVQLIPLPSGVIQIISPATYRLHELTLAGWAKGATYDRLAGQLREKTLRNSAVLPSAQQKERQSPSDTSIVGNIEEGVSDSQSRVSLRGDDSWHTLSISPIMGWHALLKFMAYESLFLLVLCYTFGSVGPNSEERLSRTIVSATLVSGLVVAAIGITEFCVWNGKILWLFIPYDWGNPQYSIPTRASGSFVNPDHFGNYLALVLPLAIGGTLFPPEKVHGKSASRILSLVTAFLLLCALLISLSRGAWIGSVIALIFSFSFWNRVSREKGSDSNTLGQRSVTAWTFLLVVATLALSITFVGPRGRNQIDLRLQETLVSDPGLAGRADLGVATLRMIEDFPLLGVGLGCWPELFPHYRKPPWQPVIYREAHNDYAQLLSETGILGIGMIGWAFILIAKRLKLAISRGSGRSSPILIALCASLLVMAFQEFFDFGLHTPANAILFTIMLALALRISWNAKISGTLVAAPTRGFRLLTICCGTFALVLIGFALAQEKTPYPHNVRSPDSIGKNLTYLADHPAESIQHLSLVRQTGSLLSPPERLSELKLAVLLDPTNPSTRDLYALTLLRQGLPNQSLRELRQSILNSPASSTHFYLDEVIIPSLSASQKEALEQGFKTAIDQNVDGAIAGLTDYYNAQGKYLTSALVYDQAATREHDQAARESLLVGAGIAYARGGDLVRGEMRLNQAIIYEPNDERPYESLITLILAPQHQLKAAHDMISRGIRNGADGEALYNALATESEVANDREMTETTLQEWADARPCFSTLYRLGISYLNDGKFSRAALILRRAIGWEPQSAIAYYYLGVAEEMNYRFTEAQEDLAKAVRLDPANKTYQLHYTEFERKVTAGAPRPSLEDSLRSGPETSE